MTNHYCDMQNADVILTIGSNNVENHPVSSKWVQRALDNGATWIVVDPRYTRSAEMADIYCPIRSGTDIAFYGGLFNYILEHDLWQHEYVLNYTNASYLLDEEYSFDVETGIFSGFDKDSATYDAKTWHYQVESTKEWDTSEGGAYAWAKAEGVPEFTPPTVEVPKRDMTLQDPMCVFQQMKKHYSRYDLDTVSATCGMDKELLEKVYATYAATGAPDKSGTILYALGQTQHTYGAQNCRSMGILQLLLGNVGVAGGGVNALRGEPNVQGATDMGMLVANQPGYLNWPTEYGTPSLRKWCEKETYADGYYTNKPKFIVSALKEWFGDAATVENDYGYDWWPKVPKSPDYSIIGSFELMSQGIIKGYFNWGMNPCHSAPNASNVRRAMANLDWLVVADWVETESATFWKAPDMNAADIDTTVYFLPAALIYEKPGTILNSGRWLQWRYQAVEPWEDAKPDYEICDVLWKAIVDLYKKEDGVAPEPVVNTKWDYYVDGKIDPRPVAWALNGYNYAEGGFENGAPDLLSTFANLKADGSTACGMWIYTGFWANNDAPLDPAEQAIGSRVAAQPSHHLQPRLGGSGRQALEPEPGAGRMDGREVGAERRRRLRGRVERHARAAQQQGVHDAVGAERAPGELRHGRRSFARALRALREPGGQQAERTAELAVRALRRVRVGQARRPQPVPHRGDHLFGHRALADRRPDPHVPGPQRGHARAVRRDVGGTGGRKGHRERRARPRVQQPRVGRGHGAGHASLQAVQGERRDRAPGGHDAPLRLGGRLRHRRHRQRPAAERGRPELLGARVQGVPRRHREGIGGVSYE